MKLRINIIQISCDGAAATGKSTGAKMIAKKYKLKFLSSGLLYRYAGFLLIKYKPKNQINFLRKKFKNFDFKKISSIDLHSQQISQTTSIIAKKYKVRKILKTFQKNFAKKNKKCCIEGRDISTEILPDSDIKFFFKCDLETASKRRFKELKKVNPKIKLKDIKKSLKIRNNRDISRKNSPLLKSRDAIIVDTSKLKNIPDMVNKMSEIIERKVKYKYGSWNTN